MRQALGNANADLVQQHPNYVVCVTSDDSDLGKDYLSTFLDVEPKTPVILTTPRLLTTGVDAPLVRDGRALAHHQVHDRLQADHRPWHPCA